MPFATEQESQDSQQYQDELRKETLTKKLIQTLIADIDVTLKQTQQLQGSREIIIAITKLQDSKMWCSQMLSNLDVKIPHTSSLDEGVTFDDKIYEIKFLINNINKIIITITNDVYTPNKNTELITHNIISKLTETVM